MMNRSRIVRCVFALMFAVFFSAYGVGSYIAAQQAAPTPPSSATPRTGAPPGAAKGKGLTGAPDRRPTKARGRSRRS